MKISFLITAFREEKTIEHVISCLVNPAFSGVQKDYELILACPDEETKNVAEEKVNELKIGDRYKFIKDPGKGKPAALNLILAEANGDILIFTDGDVYFGEKSVKALIEPFKNDKVALVTGRPKSEDTKENMMGYFGHLLSDAAHHKRSLELLDNPQGNTKSFIPKTGFFPVSGYIYAARKSILEEIKEFPNIFPENALVDDAYISYLIHNKRYKIGYAPEATAFVKYPTNLSDYFKQKKRSTGGYVQLWEYGVVKKETKTRSLRKELEYFWFPIKYASNLKELIWSFLLYPIRLWLWVMIFWERRVVKKDFVKTWVRVESTK